MKRFILPRKPGEKIKIEIEYTQPIEPPDIRCGLCEKLRPYWHFHSDLHRICLHCRQVPRRSTYHYELSFEDNGFIDDAAVVLKHLEKAAADVGK